MLTCAGGEWSQLLLLLLLLLLKAFFRWRLSLVHRLGFYLLATMGQREGEREKREFDGRNGAFFGKKRSNPTQYPTRDPYFSGWVGFLPDNLDCYWVRLRVAIKPTRPDSISVLILGLRNFNQINKCIELVLTNIVEYCT